MRTRKELAASHTHKFYAVLSLSNSLCTTSNSHRVLKTYRPTIKRWQENRQVNQSQEYKEAQRPRIATEGRFGLNIMLGLAEDAGLSRAPLFP